ncbi:MAG: hypothetical protein H6595_10495 [Flavobacteriales bacterium]|nr:hypothetical protein [Flavobacteriales bacterium]
MAVSTRDLFLTAVLIASFLSKAEAQRGFPITGRTKIEGGGLDGARIVVYKDGEKERTLSDGVGKFDLELDFGHKFILSFEKEGWVTKKLVFDTHAPGEAIANGFTPFEFAVSLFRQYDDINIVVFNQPVGMIRYEPSVDDFDYDTDYTKSIQSQLEEVMEQVADREKQEEKKAKDLAKQKAQEEKERAKAAAEAKKQEEARMREEAARVEAARKEKEQQAQAARAAEEERKAAEAEIKAEAPLPVPEEKIRKEPAPAPEPRLIVRNGTTAQANPGEDGRRASGPISDSEASPVRPAGANPADEAPPAAREEVVEVVRDEELTVEPNTLTTRITLTRAGVSTEYRRIVHKWGGVFYFKNGESCSKEVYEKEAMAGHVEAAIAGATR